MTTQTIFKILAPFSWLVGLLVGQPSDAWAQTTAASPNRGEIGITATRTTDCAGGMVFHFTNYTNQTVDVLYYFKRTNGQWSDARATNGVAAGARFDSGDTCENTGNITLYFRPAGSNARFPNRPTY